MLSQILKFSNVAKSDIDYFVLHQPNKYILNSIQKTFEISDDKFPKDTQSLYGNQNSASIPGTISGFLSIDYENLKIKSIFAGFGIGLSWGACMVQTDKLYCPPTFFQKE
jgi:3-oxoacyl-[acyl-carrier-protein] synthase-3